MILEAEDLAAVDLATLRLAHMFVVLIGSAVVDLTGVDVLGPSHMNLNYVTILGLSHMDLAKVNLVGMDLAKDIYLGWCFTPVLAYITSSLKNMSNTLVHRVAASV